MKVIRLTNIPAMFSATREKIRVLISFNFGTFFSLRYDRAFARLPSSVRRNRSADISAGNLSQKISVASIQMVTTIKLIYCGKDSS